jgi:hypothetical protein
MEINIKGADSKTKKYATSITEFCSTKLMSKRLTDRLEINIKFVPELYERDQVFGNCIWEDENVRPKEFTIELDPDQDMRKILETLAHELVHVKQFATSEMKDLMSSPSLVNWHGKRIDRKNMDYYDLPWEIEAYGREVGLFVRWAEKNKLAGQEWTQV